MSETTLTKLRLAAGVWEGLIEGAGKTEPALLVSHMDESVDTVTITKGAKAGEWLVNVTIPAAMISDGVQTFVIRDATSNETLNSFAILAGEALSSDIRAELNLLREELDMMKRAFRRHCVETM